jgi:hypothetical protein
VRSTFRLEIDVVVDTDAVDAMIACARERYLHDTDTTAVASRGGTRKAPAPAFSADVEDGLIDLFERNPLLSNSPVEIQQVNCHCVREWAEFAEAGAYEQSRESTSERLSMADDSKGEDLEEFESGLYLCRWPNGEFSVVKGDSRTDAVVQLDEWGPAEPYWLVPLETFMADFRLNDEGEVELSEFGEETAEHIWHTCYPELNDVFTSAGTAEHVSGEGSSEVRHKIRRAVEHERNRLWNDGRGGTAAKTAIGRELHKRLGTVGVVADQYAKVAADDMLREKPREKGKPN